MILDEVHTASGRGIRKALEIVHAHVKLAFSSTLVREDGI